MNASHIALRRSATLPLRAVARRQWPRFASSSASPEPRRRGGNFVAFAGVFGLAAACAYYYPILQSQFSTEPEPVEKQRPKAELKFEKARQQALSKEDNRDLLSSQHLQVKKSWENPGVYAWGSNLGKVIDPDSKEKYIKLPRRIPFFDNQLLRDLSLTQEFGAAITEKGDLVQWGVGFSKTDPRPATTLRGKDLSKIVVSADRILALSRSGNVYSLPASQEDLQNGLKSEQQKSSWSIWSSSGKEAVSFRNVTPSGLGWGERVTDISSGLEHCLFVTSKGRVFSAASSATSFPSRGQLGIPGLTWDTRPSGPYDQPHEVSALSGFNIQQVAAGDMHSVVLDKLGRVFAFGDNTFGQLGYDNDSPVPQLDSPTMIAINKLYLGSGLVPRATSIAAGGVNTFFTVDAEDPKAVADKSVAPARRQPRLVSDVWAAGQGTYGGLGNGKWTHVSSGPSKVKALSGLSEFDEKRNTNTPIKIKQLSAGTTHTAAVMSNITKTSASGASNANETNWGADVLFWGGNEYFQLGTGKRSNMNTPTYIGPLDGGDGDADKGRAGEMHRLCITPRQTARLGKDGKGRKVSLEQKVECGRFVSGVYSAV
ncbi:hypothetical protein K4F52_008621 [Lecanicillium sp. MT-2017a]|nr:hypothetical protein K4F52_008621 [Lecanicillium sp. MT-2017a]